MLRLAAHIQKPGATHQPGTRREILASQVERLSEYIRSSNYLTQERVDTLAADVVDCLVDVGVASAMLVTPAGMPLVVIAGVRCALNFSSTLVLPNGVYQGMHDVTTLMTPWGAAFGIKAGVLLGHDAVFPSARTANATMDFASLRSAPSSDALRFIKAKSLAQEFEAFLTQLQEAQDRRQREAEAKHQAEEQNRQRDRGRMHDPWRGYEPHPERPHDDVRDIPKPGGPRDTQIA